MPLTFDALDDHIRNSVSETWGRTCVPFTHPLGQLDVSLLGGVICFREGFRNDKLRHVNLVLEKIGNRLFDVATVRKCPIIYSLFRALHVPIDEHFKQTRFNDGRD